jgi:hypothetical protein
MRIAVELKCYRIMSNGGFGLPVSSNDVATTCAVLVVCSYQLLSRVVTKCGCRVKDSVNVLHLFNTSRADSASWWSRRGEHVTCALANWNVICVSLVSDSSSSNGAAAHVGPWPPLMRFLNLALIDGW